MKLSSLLTLSVLFVNLAAFADTSPDRQNHSHFGSSARLSMRANSPLKEKTAALSSEQQSIDSEARAQLSLEKESNRKAKFGTARSLGLRSQNSDTRINRSDSDDIRARADLSQAEQSKAKTLFGSAAKLKLRSNQ